MSARRFFVDDPLREGVVDLSADEARHLRVVLRGRPEDRVILFDGRGAEADALVREVGRNGARCEVMPPVRVHPRPAVRVELACAFPRAGAADDVVRVAVEVGAGAIRPLLSARGVWRPDPEDAGVRFRRAAIAALKQSGRAFLPEFLDPAEPAALPVGKPRLALVGSTSSAAQSVAEVVSRAAPLRDVVVIVGPEGGFEETEESALVARGAAPVCCGRGILRVETAVIALLAHVVAASE